MSIVSWVKRIFGIGQTNDPFKNVSSKRAIEEFGGPVIPKPEDKTPEIIDKTMEYQVIFASDASYICAEAARVCIGSHADKDKHSRLMNIGRVVKRGHESVLGHSSIVIMISFSPYYDSDLSEAMPAMKFLNVSHTSKMFDNDRFVNYLLIGGSIRAYKYFLKNIKSIENPFAQVIIESLYHSCEAEFCVDLINDGIMDKIKFGYESPTVTEENTEITKDASGNEQEENVVDTVKEWHQEIYEGKQVDLWFSDPFNEIYDFVKGYGFDIKDVLQCLSCTLLFHDFSRATSQQLTRHRAAISQESQRYVNAKDSKFINPTKFNSKQYAKVERYNVKLFGIEKTMTAQALGTELKGVYNQLISQGMLKQDARGYLPFNVSTKVMMTFTYADLLHFIKMRDADDAQPEIRKIAKEIQEQLDSNSNLKTLLSFYQFSKLIDMIETPRYKKEEEDYLSWENEVDEEVGEVREEIIENTASAVPESK